VDYLIGIFLFITIKINYAVLGIIGLLLPAYKFVKYNLFHFEKFGYRKLTTIFLVVNILNYIKKYVSF
jgi:hypothetical protein